MPQKSPKLPKNDRIFQNNIFHGYKFSQTLSKTAKSAKINAKKVVTGGIAFVFSITKSVNTVIPLKFQVEKFYNLPIDSTFSFLEQAGRASRKCILLPLFDVYLVI